MPENERMTIYIPAEVSEELRRVAHPEFKSPNRVATEVLVHWFQTRSHKIDVHSDDTQG